MDMIFLNPAFLAAGTCLAIPVWLHLRRSDQADACLLPTTRFLEVSNVTVPASRRIEDWLGLALRILALGLTVLSLAWPYRREDRSGVIPSRVVCILDNTFSHSAHDGFARARDRMASEIEGFGPEIRVAVIQLTNHPELLADFDSDRGTLAGVVRGLEPSAGRGNCLAAFMQAASLLENGGACERQVRFYTDHQANQWITDGNATGFLKATSAVVVPTSMNFRDNLAVTVGSIDRVNLGERARVRVDVGVRRYLGDSRAEATSAEESVRVQLVLEGEVVAEEAVTLSASTLAGAAKLSCEVDPARPFVAQVRVIGNRDALPGDSVAWAVLAPVREAAVEIVTPSKFLRTAFSKEVLKGYWKVIDPKTTGDVPGVSSVAGDVLVVDERELVDVTKLAQVSAYLNGGRGVLLFSGGDGSGAVRAMMGLGVEVRGRRKIAGATTLGLVTGRHAVAKALRAGEYNRLSEIGFSRLNVFDVPSAQTCLHTVSGDPVVMEVPVARGRLMVVGTGFEMGDSDWPTRVSFIPFLDACLSAVKQSFDEVLTAKPGEELMMASHRAVRGAEYRLVGENVDLPVENSDSGMVVRAPMKTGVFRIQERVSQDTFGWICVKSDELESDLSVSGKLGVPDGWMDLKSAPVSGVRDLQPMLDRDAILRQPFGRLLLLIAAGCLVVEPLVHALRRRVR
jgi:hypothetical protein